MVRTQISLTEEQIEKVKRIARERGVSMSAVMREQVDSLPENGASRDDNPFMSIIGIASGAGPTDIAENHDKYLNEGDRW